MRGNHPRFEDLFLERRLEIRVAEGEATASCRVDGAAVRWRFGSRSVMHAAAGVSDRVIEGLLSRYSYRPSVPAVSGRDGAGLEPPEGWTAWARGVAAGFPGRSATIRYLQRQAVVIRREGWQPVNAPGLVRIEHDPRRGRALLAVWRRPELGDWIRRLIEPPPRRTWSPPPGLKGPIVLTDGTAGPLLHELVGHLAEGDLVAAGRSPLIGLGGAALTEAAIDVIDDPGRFDLPGAFDADDEGVTAQPIPLLRSGRLCGLLCDRETARLCETRPGRGRRADWRSPPVPRLSNLVVTGGNHTADDLVSGVDAGLVVTRLAGASVDPVSSRAVLRVERGFEIRKGRRRRPLSRCELTGGVTEILAGIDPAVGNDPTTDWRLGWCVKDGMPLATGSEAPTLIVRNLEVL